MFLGARRLAEAPKSGSSSKLQILTQEKQAYAIPAVPEWKWKGGEMMRSIRQLSGRGVVANDGHIGHVKEFYFDDESWEVRYVVVDVGSWLRHREVILPPVAFAEPEDSDFRVDLTKKQVRESPETNTAKPISRQHQVELHQYFGWPAYWGGYEGYLGAEQVANPISEYRGEGETVLVEKNDQIHKGGNPKDPGTEPVDGVEVDPHLRSSGEVIGYHAHSLDGPVGDVADLIIDTRGWVIRYAAIDGRSHCEGKKTLISVDWIDRIHWKKSEVHVSVQKDDVCRAPEYDPKKPVSREQEEALHDLHGKDKYWVEGEAGSEKK